MSKSGKRLCCFLFTVLFCAVSLSASAQTNVLRNGSFDDGLEGWTVDHEIGFRDLYYEYDNKHVRLERFDLSRAITPLYQNLNVPGIANKSFTLSMKLICYDDTNAVSAAVDYADAGGAIHHIDVLRLNVADPDLGYWTDLSSRFSFPSEAQKLVKFSIGGLSGDDTQLMDIDDIALSAEGVVVNLVPEITSIDPARGPYGTVVTIRGANFGDNASGTGQVVTTAGPGSAKIVSWTDDMIVARVEAPIRSGWLSVIADGTESNGEFYFRIMSPYYRIRCATPCLEAVKGQNLQFVIGVDGFNGFASENGINFRVPEAPDGSVIISPTPVRNDGGTLVTVDTSSLDPGSYAWHVVSQEPNSAPQSTTISFRLTSVTDISFYDGNGPIDVLNVTTQGWTDFYERITCADGREFPWNSPKTYHVEDPSKLFVSTDGSNRFIYAQETGTTNLTVTTADGFSKTLPVNINLPPSPQVTTLTLSPSRVLNSGGQLVTAEATGTELLSISWDDSYSWWYDYFSIFSDYYVHCWDEGKRINFNGYVQGGIEPKEHLFVAYCGQHAIRMLRLTVENDPSRGLIECYAYSTSPDPNNIDWWLQYTKVEICDVSGNSIADRQWPYWQDMRHPRFWYLQPGTYRLSLRGTDNTFYHVRDQWYPNATSIAGASDVDVAAGQTIDNIYFFVPPLRPYIAQTEPEPGETEVWWDEDIYVGLAGNIDPRSVNTDSVTLRDSSGKLVPIVKADYGNFKPISPLAKLTTYTVTVSTDVRDIYGFQMEQDYCWSFTTRSDLIGHIKTLPNDTHVSLPNKILYFTVPLVGDYADAYIEEPDRSSGIMIKDVQGRPTGLLRPPLAVSVWGTMSTLPNGKRCIIGDVNFSSYADLNPLGANIKTIKSPMMDGMLVTAWGSVMPGTITANSFNISDGSDVDGVQVISISGSVNVNEGEVVVVTGAAGYDGERVIYKE